MYSTDNAFSFNLQQIAENLAHWFPEDGEKDGLRTSTGTQKLATSGSVQRNSSSSAKKKRSIDTDSDSNQLYYLLAAHIRPSLDALRAKAEQSVFRDGGNKEKLKNFQKKLDVLYLNIQLFNEGIQELSHGKSRANQSHADV